jgi:hypothetical protein
VDDLHVGHVPRHVVVQQQAVAAEDVARVQADRSMVSWQGAQDGTDRPEPTWSPISRL